MIYDGQTGPQVAYPQEETRGAFTVANLNDTDGDGTVDNVDSNGVVATAAGRDEVDLMQLDIARPYPGFEGTVTLTVPVGKVALWQESTKVSAIAVDGSGSVQFTSADFPGEVKTMYAEVLSPSSEVRDLPILLSYRAFTDTVKATGVWAEVTDVKHDRSDTNWADMTSPTPIQKYSQYGGYGLRPIPTNGGVFSVMGVCFTVYPNGIQNESNVMFDVARQIAGKGWHKFREDSEWQSMTGLEATFPPQLEWANDDEFNKDESDTPNVSGHFFSIDAPGIPSSIPLNYRELVRENFFEWIRVRFDGTRPTGNLNGSQASTRYAWHMRYDVTDDGLGGYQRTTGDNPETDSNDIGPGHITLGDNP